MNESGVPLLRIAHWWKAPPSAMLVISDDLDLPLGRLRLRASGSSGGQNGLRSIIERFGEEFPRLRVGIGRGSRPAVEHVLAPFTAEEMPVVGEVVEAAATSAVRWLTDGFAPAANYANARRASPAPADA